MQPASPPNGQQKTRTSAVQFILLLGLVSALGDITYETGRGVSGPYLALLGASAGMVGLVSGLGEFLGYALRLASGYLADRTRAYWIATFLGYGLILCIPLLAFTNHWQMAAVLLILERIGKAIRSPARDTILSYATHQTGRGWGFALHEALDQTGAVLGPLLFTAVYALRGSYQDGFKILLLPGILTIVVLAIARIRVPEPERLEASKTDAAAPVEGKQKLPRIFWIYSLFTFFSVAGFTSFQIISYHLAAEKIVTSVQIPLLYALAQGADVVAALAVGKAYDRIGLRSLAIVPFLSLPLPFLAFSSRAGLVVAGMLLWGAVMAIHETIMRAGIADLISVERRGTAYGIFNTVYGAGWLMSGLALGQLYAVSLTAIIAYVFVAEAAALAVFSFVWRNA